MTECRMLEYNSTSVRILQSTRTKKDALSQSNKHINKLHFSKEEDNKFKYVTKMNALCSQSRFTTLNIDFLSLRTVICQIHSQRRDRARCNQNQEQRLEKSGKLLVRRVECSEAGITAAWSMWAEWMRLWCCGTFPRPHVFALLIYFSSCVPLSLTPTSSSPFPSFSFV